jgi:malate/lactate dehydrogenase
LRSSPQILKRGGYVIFQLSAAKNAHRCVSEILMNHKFALKEVIIEEGRGVQRGIVFSVENT